MAQKVVLAVVVMEGDAGCRAEVKEFGFGAGCATKDDAVAMLKLMVVSNCEVIIRRVSRGETNLVTPTQLDLAKSIVENGFELQEQIPKSIAD